MREILFRGQCYTGEWVEGQYYKRTHYYGDPSVKHYIIVSTEALDYDQALEYHEVFPETVGQYVGLKDRDGTKIFEGDILESPVKHVSQKLGNLIVVTDIRECKFAALYVADYRVIGNVHDNPELLEVK